MTRIDYFVLPWYKKVLFRVAEFFKALGMGIAHFFMSNPRRSSLSSLKSSAEASRGWVGRSYTAVSLPSCRTS